MSVSDDKAVKRHARLRDYFLRAVELDGEERRRFMVEACGEDAELRAELESLVDHHLQVESSEQSGTCNQ